MAPFCVVVCGVSGCGKSTIAAALARRLACDFVEGDDYHSPANKNKMRSGAPLTDADRQPWLTTLHASVIEQALAKGASVVLSCSALKRRYRETLRGAHVHAVFFLQVAANREVIEPRLKAREGHFMPVTLLESQIATCEPLDLSSEWGLVVDPALSIEDIANLAEQALSRGHGITGPSL